MTDNYTANYKNVLAIYVARLMDQLRSPQGRFAAWLGGIAANEAAEALNNLFRYYLSERGRANDLDGTVNRIRHAFVVGRPSPEPQALAEAFYADAGGAPLNRAHIIGWQPHPFVSHSAAIEWTAMVPPPRSTCYICGEVFERIWHTTTVQPSAEQTRT